MIPVSSVLTLDTVAANFTLLVPARTLTEAGTLMAELLLDMCTWSPPDGAAMLVRIVQVSAPAPDILASSQFKSLISAEPVVPLPCSIMAAAAEEEELVTTLSWPEESESLLGEK